MEGSILRFILFQILFADRAQLKPVRKFRRNSRDKFFFLIAHGIDGAVGRVPLSRLGESGKRGQQ